MVERGSEGLGVEQCGGGRARSGPGTQSERGESAISSVGFDSMKAAICLRSACAVEPSRSP